jgi:hypothetical protein
MAGNISTAPSALRLNNEMSLYQTPMDSSLSSLTQKDNTYVQIGPDASTDPSLPSSPDSSAHAQCIKLRAISDDRLQIQANMTFNDVLTEAKSALQYVRNLHFSHPLLPMSQATYQTISGRAKVHQCRVNLSSFSGFSTTSLSLVMSCASITQVLVLLPGADADWPSN